MSQKKSSLTKEKETPAVVTAVVENNVEIIEGDATKLEIVIVAKDNLAYKKIIQNEDGGKFTSFKTEVLDGKSQVGTISALKTVIQTMERVKEKQLAGITRIYTLDNIVNGIEQWKYRLAKGGKTLTGKEYPTEEVEAWKAFYAIYTQMFLSVTFRSVKELDEKRVSFRDKRNQLRMALVGYTKEGWTKVGAEQNVKPEAKIQLVDSTF